MNTDCFLTIIGGGVIGSAVARTVSSLSLGENIFLLDKNTLIIGDNQSARNSGIIHAGIYYNRVQSPLKVKCCVSGNRLLYDFCKTYDLTAKMTGKLVIAIDEQEDQSLEQLLKCSQNNQVPGVKKFLVMK